MIGSATEHGLDCSRTDLPKPSSNGCWSLKPESPESNAHAALDRAVWNAYGWPADEIPAEAEEDVVLSRLPGLNQERVRS